MDTAVRGSDDAFASVVSLLQEWVDAEFAAVVATWGEDDGDDTGGGHGCRCVTGAAPEPGGTDRGADGEHRHPHAVDAGGSGLPGRRVRSPPSC